MHPAGYVLDCTRPVTGHLGSTTADARVSIIRVMTCRLGRATAAEGHQFTLTDGGMSAAATVPANSSQLTARSKPRVN